MRVKTVARQVGRFRVEHETADQPGRWVKKDALELWTVLAPAGRLDIPGLGGSESWEVVASSYESEADALARARKKLRGEKR